MRRTSRLVALAACVAVLTPTVAVGAGGWSRPTRFAEFTHDVVVAGPSEKGLLVAARTRRVEGPGRPPQVATHRPGQGWTSFAALSASPARSAPVVAVNSRGAAVVAYVTGEGRDEVHLVRRTPRRGWGQGRLLYRLSERILRTNVVLDDQKRVTVVVTTITGRLLALSRSPGEPVEHRELGAVRYLPSSYSGWPEAAVSATGVVVVVWDCPQSGMCAARRTGTGWRRTAELDVTAGEQFAIAVGPRSTAMLVTSRGEVWRSSKSASLWQRDARFRDYITLDIAVGARGKAVVCNGNAVAFRSPNGTWSRLRPVSDRPQSDTTCSITVDGHGTYTITWLERVRGKEMTAAVQGRAGQRWSAPVLLGEVEQDYSFQVHSDASESGHVMVVYQDEMGEHVVFNRAD